jgi:uncharacterized membrane protein YdjX (TVP38/TMEM64 family)
MILCAENGVELLAKKRINRRALLNFLGVTLIIIAVALLALTGLMQVQQFAERYDEVLKILSDFEDAVAAIQIKGLVVIAILLIYLSKSVIPIPISAVCVIAGMVFPTYVAALINIAGFIILLTVKYFWGKHLGGGFVHKILSRYETFDAIFLSEFSEKGGLLVTLRLVPNIPINTVSQVYGAMNYDFYKYIFFSLLGFMPKIISYSMVGRHVYNPFSLAFMLPLVIVFTISGLATLGINAFIDLYINSAKTKSEKSKENKQNSEG